MKNIKFWTILGVLSLSITCSIAYSSTSKASAGLQSKGKLVYQDPVSQQEVIMDANDHTILKGSIDANSGQILSLKEFQVQQETLNQELQQKDTEMENEIQGINDSLGGLTFTQDDEGKWGYKPSGADAVIPFSAGIYKFSYQYSRMSGVSASQDLSFTINETRTYKVIPICAGNGYAVPSISIEKNGSNIKTITGASSSSIDTTEFELELNQGDTITVVFPVGTTNAATFAGLIFM